MTCDPITKILACDTDIVIHAGAGCGKTHALVEKYVSELIREREGGYLTVENIVAITFTEKAADEMRERVRRRLTELILERTQETGSSISSAGELDMIAEGDGNDAALAHLVRARQNLSSAYISTIHSFCARLLTESPVVAKVDPRFSILAAEDANDLLRESARAVILRRLQTSEESLVRLLMARGFEPMEGARGRAGLAAELGKIIPLFRSASRTIAEERRQYDAYRKSLAGLSALALPQLVALLPQLEELRKGGIPYKLAAWLREEGGKYLRLDLDTADAIELFQKAAWVETTKGTNKESGIAAAILLRQLAGYVLEEAGAQEMYTFLSLIDETANHYRDEKEKRSYLDFDDLQERALESLKQGGELLAECRERIARLLVDEYQDTNEIQRRIIEAIAPPGEGRLLVVGDMKQSIYGFRGADCALFNETATRIVDAGGTAFTLKSNRRSTPDLITFSNRFFSRLMADERVGDHDSLFVPERDALSPHRDGAGVATRIERFITDPPESGAVQNRLFEGGALARMIRNEVEIGQRIVDGNRSATYADYTILLQTLSHVRLYEAAFGLAQVPFTLVGGGRFYGSLETMDLLNFLKLLDHGADRLALCSALRSPLGGFGDDTLLKLCYSPDGKATDPSSFLLHTDPVTGIDGDEAAKLNFFRNMVQKLRPLRHRLTISELLEEIIDQSGYGAVMIAREGGERRLGNVFKLIEIARRYETDGRRGLQNFIEMLEQSREREVREQEAGTGGDGRDAVTIMTTHQSKGLEFPIVILADLGFVGASHTGSVLFPTRSQLALKYFYSDAGFWVSGPRFLAVADEEKRANLAERKRLLYVAMTRACDHLILSGPSDGRGIWRQWIDTMTDEPETQLMQHIVVPPLPEPANDTTSCKPSPAATISYGAPPKKSAHTDDIIVDDMNMSVTRLALFRSCARRYYYRHIAGIEPEQGEPSASVYGATETGARIHDYLAGLAVRGALSQASEPNLVATAMTGLPHKNWSELPARMEHLLACTPLDNMCAAPNRELYPEEPILLRLTAETGTRITLTGRADLVWAAEDFVDLVDYKYAIRGDYEERYRFQISLYALAWAQINGARKARATLCYLREEKKPVTIIELNQTDLERVRQEALDMAEKLARYHPERPDEWAMLEACNDRRCPSASLCFPGRPRAAAESTSK